MLYACLLLVLSLATLNCSNKAPNEILSDINLPKGFKIEVYAEDVSGARSMVLGNEGTLFVGSRGAGKVYAILDKNKDQKADTVIVIAADLDAPNGVAFKDGTLYVAESERVIKFDDIENRLHNPPLPTIVSNIFPSQSSHGWKYLAIGPDDKLYVPVGAPCNVCNPEDSIYSTITRMDLDGSNFEIYAKGIRNTVGFDWHPQSNILYFTDNGRDWLGDNRPPDELNKAPEKGMHFGFPFCHGNNFADPKFGNENDCEKYAKPLIELGPHVAALGMKFYTGDMFPATYKNQVFIAEHGSWNRTNPIGYRVTLVKFNENNEAVSYEPFAEGWLKNGNASGRPVDVLIMPDGAMLVSDDYADIIYRITYGDN